MNVLGFVPVGLVLGEFGLLWAVVAAVLMSGIAETSQLAMLYRDASVSDFVGNVVGAFIGGVVSAYWRIRSPALRVNRLTAFAAAALAFVLVAKVWAEKGPAVNARGTSSSGSLEAYWKLDETRGRVAHDSSGHDLNGRFRTEPVRVSSPGDTSVAFDGKKQYIDVGRSTALRLAGSMTITAWINSSSFPSDDAAIVSQLHSGLGYQLDTTIDKGPRTVGFKLTNACGDLMARYGASPVVIGTWYHVAGVYDAPRRTLDVYLNGKLDDGPSIGPVTSTQLSSRWSAYLGRRRDLDGNGFAGSSRDVRIYSLALTSDEIADVMRRDFVNGTEAGPAPARASVAGNTSEAANTSEKNLQCRVISEDGDQWIPLTSATVGVLVAFAWLGLSSSANPLMSVLSSSAAGLLFLPAIAPNVPPFDLWLIPLVALTGGVCVAVSADRCPESSHVETLPVKQLR